MTKHSIISLILSALIGLTGCASAVPAPQVSGLNAPARDARFVFGISSAVSWGPDSIAYIRSLGASSVRVDAPWKYIEKERGVFNIPSWLEQVVNTAIAAGQEPLLILDYGNPLYSSEKPKSQAEVESFRRYAVFVVNHFKGRVHLYELWNEWNGRTGGTTPGDVESYVAFAHAIVPAIRTADPQAKILSQGVSPGGVRGGWLDKFIEVKGYHDFDGIALHPYGWPWKTDRSPEAVIGLVDRLQLAARASNNGLPVDFYITEMGWPTYNGELGESRDAAAAYLSRFFVLSFCRPYIRGVWWYGLFDNGTNATDAEHNFGVYDFNRQDKAAAVAMRATIETLQRGNGQCTVTQEGEFTTAKMPGRNSGSSIVLRWQGGDIAPGGAAFPGQVVRAQSAVEEKPLFKLSGNSKDGVPMSSDQTKR